MILVSSDGADDGMINATWRTAESQISLDFKVQDDLLVPLHLGVMKPEQTASDSSGFS